jgi:hypothetical protein
MYGTSRRTITAKILDNHAPKMDTEHYLSGDSDMILVQTKIDLYPTEADFRDKMI